MIRPHHILPIVFLAFLFGAVGYVKAHRAPHQLEETQWRVSSPRERWAVDLLRAVGNREPTPATIAFVVAWQAEENTTARFNPLATSQDMPGATLFNSHGVKEYSSYEEGIAATVKTLSYSYTGYADILAGLQTNNPALALSGLSSSPWAAEAGYGERVRGLWERQSRTTVSLPNNVARADIVPDWRSRINAGFYTVDCRFWSFQTDCQHFGTDIAGDGEGTPVYAPVSGVYAGCQDNGASGPYIGKWVEYTADDGARFLINHFRDSPYCAMPPGTRIEAGAFLGTMRGDANHVHVQISVGGQLVDFEEYIR
jgi:murein DD-endopeptidase MepM/ murein hydrolase activator NlpD